MSKKVFISAPTREPKSMENDPAYKHATTIFGKIESDVYNESISLKEEDKNSPALLAVNSATIRSQEVEASKQSIPQSGEPVSEIILSRPMNVESKVIEPQQQKITELVKTNNVKEVPQELFLNKNDRTTFYASADQRYRLSMLRVNQRVADTFVLQFALERLFVEMDDEHIGASIRERGMGLRRKKTK